MKQKRSIKDMLIETGYIQKPGTGDLRHIKFDSDGVMVSDEIESDEEQKKINAEKLKKALQVMGRGR